VRFSPPPGWEQLVPELGIEPGDLRVTKLTVGAFAGTPLDMLLRRAGATQIFMAGIATGSGVESTARAGYDLGYNVAFVADAMTDRSAEVQDFCLRMVFPRLGEITDTAELLSLLEG
jgi:nicotinamidase-related amidase